MGEIISRGGEEWRPVVGVYGAEDSYEVSSLGRVRRSAPVLSGSSRQGRVLKQRFRGKYLQVWLSPRISGRTSGVSVRVHVLVAAAFIGPRPPGLVINHKDLDPTNNRADNLEYCTQAENVQHAIDNGAFDEQRTAMRKRAKVTPAQVVEVRRRAGSGESQTALAREYGLSQCAISNIVNRKTYRHIP